VSLHVQTDDNEEKATDFILKHVNKVQYVTHSSNYYLIIEEFK